MTRTKQKRNRKAVCEAKIAEGTFTVTPPKKKKLKSVKPKRAKKNSRPSTAAVDVRIFAEPIPEFAVVERRPYHAPNRAPFLGGGIVRPLTLLLSAGWQLLTVLIRQSIALLN
jgi:hypothetical protein